MSRFQAWLLAKYRLESVYVGAAVELNRALQIEYQRRLALAEEPCDLDPLRSGAYERVVLYSASFDALA